MTTPNSPLNSPNSDAAEIAKFDASALNTIHGISKDVVAEIGSRDELSKKIYASYLQFRNLIADWGEISGRYLSSRSLA